MAITTRNGKVLNDPISLGTKHEQVLDQAKREKDELEKVYYLDNAQSLKKTIMSKRKRGWANYAFTTDPKTTSSFPSKTYKESGGLEICEFITILRQLSVNIPTVEALYNMLGYAKFMKDLVTKKGVISIDLTSNVHYCSIIATSSLVQKKEDPRAFIITCTIWSIKFSKALYDLGASINLMLLAIYMQLGLGVPKPTSMRLMVKDS